MGRKSNEQKAREAAEMASSAAQSVQSSTEPQGDSDFKQDYVAPTEREENSRPTPRNEPRRMAMDEIIARDMRNKGIKDELEEPAAKTEPEAKTDPIQSETSPTENKQASEPVTTIVSTETVTPAVKTIRVKVDGEEFDAPEDEVNEAGGIKAYQRERASDNRLKKTNEALAEAKKTQAALIQFLQQQAATQAPAAPQQSVDEFIQQQVDVIRFGSAEESAAALKAVLDKTTQKVDQNQIIGQAISVMQQQAAESAFVQEFSDIVHNPLLLKLIINMKDERIKSNQGTQDWNTFYRSIGNEVRGAIGRPNQSPTSSEQSSTTTGSTSTGTSDKEARKASITNLPTAAARAVLPEADKPETRESILQQMRKSRGIQTG